MAEGKSAIVDNTKNKLEERAINSIRALTIDATQAAGSGHPGMPMGTAPMAYVVFKKFLRFNPKNAAWMNRDRFVQSAGHGSMLIYSLLHLTGYDLSMDELRRYRQLGSKTPGHPENFLTEGIETTTGPLGQGISTAVGIALAERHLAATYNRPGFALIDHYTYVIASDGDLMEGVSNEASSLAGHWGLGKLIVLYDDNQITIDGPTSVSFSEEVLKRYDAYGWHTQRVENGHDTAALEAAIRAAKEDTERPSIIACRTIIGYGAPKEGTSKVHGSVLGDEGAEAAKARLGIDWPEFTVPDDVLTHYREAVVAGEKLESAWREQYNRYRQEYPELSAQLERVISRDMPHDLEKDMPRFEPGGKGMATRVASGKVLEAFAKRLPELVGGSADLAGSNNTTLEGIPFIQKGDYGGRNIHFGVREHGMAAIANGLSLHRGIRPYVATFLIFSDYLRPSLRLAALMKEPVIYILTHDSIGLGGDGPTHQPVAQLMALRAIPNLTVFRPADANETAQAWACTLESKRPVVLALSRQDLPILDVPPKSVEKGAYILADTEGTPDVILIGTGSEVYKCLEARELLAQDGINARVVSMPSFEMFEAQDAAYREKVLPKSVRHRVAVEAGASLGWYKYVGLDGDCVALDRFGTSAEGDEVMEALGFTAQNIAAKARKLRE